MAGDPNHLKIGRDLGRREIVFGLARVPNSQRLFFGGSDFRVYEVDFAAEKLQPQELYAHDSYVTRLTLAGGTLVSGSYDQKLIWWDIESGQQIRVIENAHTRWIRNLAASPDGKLVASVADDMVCRVWETATGRLVHELKGHEPVTPNHYPSMLYALNISADGKLLATGDKVGHNVVWDLQTGQPLAEIETPGMYTWDPRQRRHSIGGVRSVAFSCDGQLLAVGGIGQIGNVDHLDGASRIEVFDWLNGQRLFELADDKQKGLVEQIQFSHDHAWFAAAGGNHEGFLKIFDLKQKKFVKEEKAPMHVHSFVLNESSDSIFAVGHGRIVRWDMKA